MGLLASLTTISSLLGCLLLREGDFDLVLVQAMKLLDLPFALHRFDDLVRGFLALVVALLVELDEAGTGGVPFPVEILNDPGVQRVAPVEQSVCHAGIGCTSAAYGELSRFRRKKISIAVVFMLVALAVAKLAGFRVRLF